MMEKELISIIVPVYNAKQYLRSCAGVLCNQTYENIEIILVDDGSTDGSGHLCDELQAKDSRIAVIHQPNSGISGARNRGIAEAHGSFLAFVDSDDLVSSDYIRLMWEAHVKTGCRIAMCSYQTFSNSREIQEVCAAGPEKVISSHDAMSILNSWRNEDATNMIVAWGKLYDRTMFEQLNFPLGKWHEDEFLIHRLLGQTDSIARIPDKLYFYRQHEQSYMQQRGAQHLVHRMSLLEAYIDRIQYMNERYPDLIPGAVEHLLQETNCSYDEMARYPELKTKQEQILKQYQMVYEIYENRLPSYLRKRSRLFLMAPKLYQEISALKNRLKSFH